MKVLVDTHILLWVLTDSDRLPPKAVEILRDNTIYYSVISLWEIERNANESGFNCISFESRHISKLSELDLPEHKDPFDRILLCQAIADNYTFLTHDSKLPLYNLPCVLYV